MSVTLKIFGQKILHLFFSFLIFFILGSWRSFIGATSFTQRAVAPIHQKMISYIIDSL